MSRVKNKIRVRRGQALIEFALVLPLLLILLLFIVQYGIIYRTAISLTNLSREGARYAATSPGLDSDIVQRVQDSRPATLNSTDIMVKVTPDEGDTTRVRGSGAEITVTISYDMSKKLFLPATFLGAHIFATTYTTHSTFAVE